MSWLKDALVAIAEQYLGMPVPPREPPPVSAREARRRWEEQRAREARERAGL